MTPVIIAENITGSIRIAGFAALFILALMWDTAMMSSRNDRLTSEPLTKCFVKRSSAKVGFHRDVTTVVVLPEELLKGIDNLNKQVLFIKEHIPPGLYVDLYQTKGTEEFGGPEVYSSDDIDVEKPEHLSSPHDVHVFTKLEKHGSFYQSAVTLPIHLRYHKPSPEQSFDQIHLEAPDIYLIAQDTSATFDEEPVVDVCDSSGKKRCHWQRLSCNFEPEGGTLEFSVPVGQIDHTTIVASVTLSLTIFSTLFLAHAIIRKKQKLKKQQ